ncbi:hypothetical protein BP5796_12476 [Coleophoma crateriformis]|uniref:NACHT domain-containing protein n=1 Tax=Coleophoma crateriformis TaxID=565419 RepID=A0A3D8Q752_9HELO|nr:hypothetical protein BP5796_12476 [Coleophoma crateriformis]
MELSDEANIASLKDNSLHLLKEMKINENSTDNLIKWYMEIEDSQICIRAKETRVKLTRELLCVIGDDVGSRQLIENITSASGVIEVIKFHQDSMAIEKEKEGIRAQILARFETFCIFADKISQIVQVMVPQDPKFTIPYGCLALLFKAVALNRERQEKLDAFLVDIVDTLPVAEAYAELYNTRQIKEVVALIFVAVLEFLIKATIYFRRNNLKKVVDCLFKPTSDRFETYITRLKDYKIRLGQYQTLASAAHQDTTLKSVQEISGAIATFRREIDVISQDISARLDVIEKSLNQEKEMAHSKISFSVPSKLDESNRLADVLLPNSKYFEAELNYAKGQLPEMSQRHHWQNIGVIDDLTKWSHTSNYRPLLWLSVTAGNQGTWVTQMTAEYQATWTQGDVHLICIFAGVYVEEKLSTQRLLSLLIIRIMEKFPLVIFEIPEMLNTRVLGNATLLELWGILNAMIKPLQPLLIIIDRIDLCECNNGLGAFLDNMETLVSNHKGDLRVIFTSAETPPVLVQRADLFETIQSSARIKPSRRYNR